MSQIERNDSPYGTLFSVDGERNAVEKTIEASSFLDRLRDLETRENVGEENPLSALLQLGTEWFEVEHGHFAKVDVADGTHTIAAASGAHSAVSEEKTRDLSTTYSRTVIAENAVLDLRNAPEEGWNEDPAYEAFGFCTYLGTKVVANGTFYGTPASPTGRRGTLRSPKRTPPRCTSSPERRDSC